jgi:two-component system, OmpR family, phosphate regulon sensor histidine kinase PhoR
LPKRWVSHLLQLGAWVAIALVLGVTFGRPGWWVAFALAVWLAATLQKLYDLDRVLDGRPARWIVTTSGLWAELLARVVRYKDKAAYRKKKYHRLLREVRESTGALRDAGVILNPQNEIEWFNVAATALLGLESPRDIGQRIDNLVRHPDFVGYLNSAKDRVIYIPAPKDPTGRLSVQIIPYSRRQRLAIFRDVTHEYRLERTRRDFVANASHELRSPLTVFGGYLETMLEDSAIPSTWDGPIEEMQRQVDRMTRIIRDLLELSRLESMEGQAGHDFVDVTGMLKAIGKEMSQTAPGLTLDLDLDENTALLGEETQLHSIFFNLINNAIRFTPEPGSVHILWKRIPGGACFEVRDTGIGIPEELIPRVTERFFRVDPGRSRASGGTGLGLAIVKHALQKHGATLRIESKLGEGSTFRCDFPDERVVARGGVRQTAVQG